MKRFLTLFIALGTAILLHAAPQASPSASPPQELRAVWVATIGGIDWPRTYATDSRSIALQKEELTRMLDQLQLVGINTILLQTRVRATTIYPSRLEPWDGCMSGKPGQSPGYDPLAFAIDECHRRGMKLQAWVVTIPVGKWNAAGCTRLRKLYPKAVVKIGAEGYLNPEHPQTADILCDICKELTENYNIDGIHLDYIRYPEQWRQKVNREQGRRHITSIVSRIRQTVKAIRPDVLLTCAPLGKHDDLTRYPSRGWNCRQTVMQDAQAWLKEGLVDQLYPMLYFRGNNFYPFAIDWAENMPSAPSDPSSPTGQNRRQATAQTIAAGLGAYCLDRREGDWPLSEMVRQLHLCRQIGIGQCFFRARFLTDNTKGIYDFLRLFNHADLAAPGSRLANNIMFAREDMASDRPTPSVWQPGTLDADVALAAYTPAHRQFPPYYLPNDGLTVSITQADTDYIIIESMVGNVVQSCTLRGHKADISRLPAGIYFVRSVNRKGVTHRIGMIQVQR